MSWSLEFKTHLNHFCFIYKVNASLECFFGPYVWRQGRILLSYWKDKLHFHKWHTEQVKYSFLQLERMVVISDVISKVCSFLFSYFRNHVHSNPCWFLVINLELGQVSNTSTIHHFHFQVTSNSHEKTPHIFMLTYICFNTWMKGSELILLFIDLW